MYLAHKGYDRLRACMHSVCSALRERLERTRDPLLFEFNASGSQRLILQPSYWVLGHLSRAARPGATVVGSGGAGVCTAPGDYEQIRAYATDREARAAAGLKLLAVAFRSAGLDEGLLSLYIPILICM